LKDKTLYITGREIRENVLAPLPYSTHPTTRLYEVWQKEADEYRGFGRPISDYN